MTDEVVPVEGQVPAWSDEDEARLRVRASRLTAAPRTSLTDTFWLAQMPELHPGAKEGIAVGVAVEIGHFISIVRQPPPSRKCPSCGLRRVLYVVNVSGKDTRSFCFACWTGHEREKPE